MEKPVESLTPRSEVYNADCLDVMRKMPDNYIDLAIADPPYSHQGERIEVVGGRFHGGNRWDKFKKVDGKPIDNEAWDVAPEQVFFDELFRISKNQIIWGANYFPNMPATRCFVIWKKFIPEQFSMAMCEYAWTSFAMNAKIVEFDQRGTADDPRFHPTAKPVALYAWLLRNFAKEGDLIFDPMMGSMASRIAAFSMGFDYIGCEIEPLFFEKGQERFEKMCMGIEKRPDGRQVQQLSLF